MAASSERGYDVSQWYDSKPVKIGWFAMLAIGVFWWCISDLRVFARAGFDDPGVRVGMDGAVAV